MPTPQEVQVIEFAFLRELRSNGIPLFEVRTYSSVPLPDSLFFRMLLTPHSSLLTPHSSLLSPHS
ncbi:hypothetical protein [Egbenema bharatensis]|uniref:hypothetical protein n=1 Tax=Egbenema bharatensis TaxID=3463334 RepID=UPI003A8A1998